MKTNRQRKKKSLEVCKALNDSKCCLVTKKSKKNQGKHQRETAVEITNKCESFLKTTKKEPASNIKAGGLHSFTKIKLQLFPINDSTRTGLEKAGHNPFLELTLSARKRISSVIRHLNTKWASSHVALGELVLVPYDMKLKTQATHKAWTENDNGVSAEDVYLAIGSPAVFRLRYGWLINVQSNTLTSAPTSAHQSDGISKSCHIALGAKKYQTEELEAPSEEPISMSNSVGAVAAQHMPLDVPVSSEGNEVKIDTCAVQSSVVQWDDNLTNLSIGDLLSEVSLLPKTSNGDLKSEDKSALQTTQLVSNVSIGGLLAEVSPQDKINNPDLASSYQIKMDRDTAIQEGFIPTKFPWDDSLTTLSVGGLLSEASLLEKINQCDQKSNGTKSTLLPALPISDSFDAFIASQINVHPQPSKSPSVDSVVSIFDAEETCHAFPSAGRMSETTSMAFKISQFSEESKGLNVLPHSQFGEENSSLGLTGIKWSGSLGAV